MLFVFNVVEILCKHDADLNLFNYAGQTPLYCATDKNLKEIVYILCKHGANLNLQNKNS